MKQAVYYISFILLSTTLVGQQDNHYTHIQYGQLNQNPAFAGQNDELSFLLRNRNQWSGIIGAPQSQNFIVNLPLWYDALGFGFGLNRYTIGVSEKLEMNAAYAYKLKLKASSFSLGLQFSYRKFSNDFTDETLIAINGFELDPSIDRIFYTQNIFNVGFGFLFKSANYYLGAGVPRLTRANLDLEIDQFQSTEVRHIYATAGSSFELNNEWTIKPATLVKIAENAPFDLDLQTNFIYRNQIHLGLNIRAGGSQNTIFESLAIMLGMNFHPNLLASISYDFNTTILREYEDGSFEFLLKYRVSKDRSPKDIQNPRYY